jgi:hypothetical protein
MTKYATMDEQTKQAVERDKKLLGRAFIWLHPDGMAEHVPADQMIIDDGELDPYSMIIEVLALPANERVTWDGILDAVRALVVTPTPMWLTCPHCREPHVDVGEFATKPHHTHSCQKCGLTWRPTIRNTVGVRFLPGFKNESPRNPLDPGDGILEQISYPNDDGSFTVVKTSHHKGCSARKDCECSPIRTTDRHYPSPL